MTPTDDVAFIVQILSDPEIYPRISDDSGMDTAGLHERVQAAISVRPDIVFLRCADDIGLIMVHKHTYGMAEVHTCILAKYRGRKAFEAAHQALSWIWQNTTVGVITTYVLSDDKPVLWFAKKCGFSVVGTVPASLCRNGVYFDQIILSFTRPSCQ